MCYIRSWLLSTAMHSPLKRIKRWCLLMGHLNRKIHHRNMLVYMWLTCEFCELLLSIQICPRNDPNTLLLSMYVFLDFLSKAEAFRKYLVTHLAIVSHLYDHSRTVFMFSQNYKHSNTPTLSQSKHTE